MHLLVATPGGGDSDEGIVSLEQSPGDIVVLSAQDTDLALLATSVDALPAEYPSVRLANLMYLKQPAAMDLYVEEVIRHARLVIASLLGGRAYWHYQTEQLLALARTHGLQLVLMPGDDQPDPELFAAGTVATDTAEQIWRYTREGGVRNAGNLFAFIHQQFFSSTRSPSRVEPPRPMPRTLLYHPSIAEVDFAG